MAMINFDDKVALNENPQIPDINKILADNINEIKNALNNEIYPINIIVPFYDDVDRSNWLDYTWEKVAVGKNLVGQDVTQTEFDTIGKLGGTKEVTLAIENLPAHTHPVRYQNSLNFSGNASAQTIAFTNNRIAYFQADGSASSSDLVAIGVGGNQSHNNLQPYEVVTYWRRIA